MRIKSRLKYYPNPDIESCHCERTEAISHFSSEIATYPSGIRNSHRIGAPNWGQVFILAVGKKIGDVAKLNNILSRAK